MKSKTVFRCSKCDAQFPRWEGRCRECDAWGTLKEDTIVVTRGTTTLSPSAIVDLRDVSPNMTIDRLPSGFDEFDRVLGGGFVAGSLTLLGGDPGIGKSTLLLQVSLRVAQASEKLKENTGIPREAQRSGVLYISGEESAEQVRSRISRIGEIPATFKFLGDSSLETIASALNQVNPALLIVDSLQTVRTDGAAVLSKPGELKKATEELMTLAKRTNTPIVLIGHVTKDGAVAGPKALEHLVDAVIYFEKSDSGPYRILRAVKNRFGGISEIGVWQMTSEGLSEVTNPSGTFLDERKNDTPGSAITAVLEGSRVFLVEIQALVTKTRFGYPQRRASGFDLNRLQLLVAVLSKRANLPLAYYDIHLNVVGGLRVNEPAADLAVALAIASALKNTPVEHHFVAIGEVGLQGEIRSVTELDRRLDETGRLGFTQALVPPNDATAKSKKIERIGADSVSEAITIALKT